MQGYQQGQNVDWAALAQQWIHTTQTQNNSSSDPAQGNTDASSAQDKGGGEASMDLCDPDDQNQNASGWEGLSWNHGQQMNNWNNWQQAGNGGGGWPQGGGNFDWQQQQGNNWGGGDFGWSDQSHGNGNWNNDFPAYSQNDEQGRDKDYSHLVDEYQENRSSSRSRKRNLPSLMQVNTQEPSYQTLNEDQRKKLPPWIREGLEKMERDKRKKEEDEMRKERANELKKQRREQEMKINKSLDPSSSKFDLSGSESGSEKEEEPPAPAKQTKPKARSRFEDVNEMVQEAKGKVEVNNKYPLPPKLAAPVKSKEEILEEMTMNLRKLMTTILLEVTSEEIKSMAVDLHAKEKDKMGKPKIKNMLSGYGSNSDSEEDADSDDDDLERVLNRKKKKFREMEDDIRDECDKKEEEYKSRERRWLTEGRKAHREKSTTPSSKENSVAPSKETSSRSASRSPSKAKSKSRSPTKERKTKKSSENKKEKNGKKRSRSPKNSDREETSSKASKKKKRSKSRDKKSRSRSRGRRSRSRGRKSRSKSRSRRKRSRSRTEQKTKKSKRSRSRESRRSRSRSKNRKNRSRTRSRDRRSRSKDKRSRSRSRSERHKKSKKSRRRSSS